MSKYPVDDVRDIALVGHRASGKTSLADALLYEAHAVSTLGSVDDGTSVSDYDFDEHAHHFSIDTAVLHADHGGKHLHILDAPGTPDFIGAAIEALAAVETAVVVVSAVAGVEVHTRRMFHEAGRLGLARAIVVNKIDAEGIDFPTVIEDIRTAFGKHCVPFNLPNDTGPRFQAVIDVVRRPVGVPTTHPFDQRLARTMLIEAVAETDEVLLEKYLTEGSLNETDLNAALPKCVAAGFVVPIFCTSAKKDKGVRELLDALGTYGLSPKACPKKLAGLLFGVNGQATQVEANAGGEFLGQVFKVVNDRYIGHLSFIRVLSGTLTPNHTVIDLNNGKSVRVGQLLSVQGKTHVPVQEAVPGDIVAVAKVDGLNVGDTVAFRADAPQVRPLKFPAPMFGLAVEPKTRGDEQKLANGLHKIAEEDPTVRITHDSQTHELVISGVSPMHLEVVKERLKHRFDVDIVTRDPKIPYRETVTGTGEGDHRHKKQTGGRGQFAEVHLRVYPLSRDTKTLEQLTAEFANKGRFEKLRDVRYDPATNFAFLDHVVGGTIPSQYLPAVEKGLKEAMDRGVLAGHRVQDVAVEVYFGKEHPVDSSEAAFKTAAKHAFRKAFLAAKPVLLEPVVKLSVTVPSRFTGAVLGDLPVRRAHVLDQDTLGGDQTVIHVQAPLAEMARYAAQLGGLTQGQGSYVMELSHYEPVPAAVQQQIVAGAKLAHDEDE